MAISRTHAPGSLNLNTGDNIRNTLSHTNKMFKLCQAHVMLFAVHWESVIATLRSFTSKNIVWIRMALRWISQLTAAKHC